jgi:hypothetical protein
MVATELFNVATVELVDVCHDASSYLGYQRFTVCVGLRVFIYASYYMIDHVIIPFLAASCRGVGRSYRGPVEAATRPARGIEGHKESAAFGTENE